MTEKKLINSDKLLIKNIMIEKSSFACANEDDILADVISNMNKFGIGIACVTNDEGKLSGILTDGDLRRIITKIQKPFSALVNDDVNDYTIKKPITITPDQNINDGIKIMEKNLIWDIPVVDENGFLLGLLHLHGLKKILDL